jgi:4-methyl-5(b-hydroxyethyl)-thiazole monophosphate biosynthesis
MTCYPGWEEKCINAQYTGVGVITDGTITTGRGLGFAIDFALELLRLLKGSAQADEVKKGIQHPSTI